MVGITGFLSSRRRRRYRSVYCCFGPAAYPAAGCVARGRTPGNRIISPMLKTCEVARQGRWCAPVGQARTITIPGEATALQNQPPADFPDQPLPSRWPIPLASRSTIPEKTASVSTLAGPITPDDMTPVISSRTNPCNAAQNSKAA